jgi:hypothetical protein
MVGTLDDQPPKIAHASGSEKKPVQEETAAEERRKRREVHQNEQRDNEKSTPILSHRAVH